MRLAILTEKVVRLNPKRGGSGGGGEVEVVSQQVTRPVFQDQMVAINITGLRIQRPKFSIC
jgi:hypothetical protein